MDIYTSLVVDGTSTDECLQVARYYETMGEFRKAGELLERCGESGKALKLYLSLANDGGIEQAFDLVARERNENLTAELFEHLENNQNGSSIKQYYLYMLHRAFGNYEEAANLVSALATGEQESGNYKKAHQLLLDFCLVVQAPEVTAPMLVLNQLMLLHSYILVKVHIRLGNHSMGSQLLIRVAQNVLKFPCHAVPILTSAVIECDRSGLKTTAFEFASMLMDPEYRNAISPVYKRKVEKIVRKCEKVEEREPATPCPVCSELLPNMQLHCKSCKSDIPFCIASGRHMVLGDWTVCPQCKFPALATEFIKVLEDEESCPMCSNQVASSELKCIENPNMGGIGQSIPKEAIG